MNKKAQKRGKKIKSEGRPIRKVFFEILKENESMRIFKNFSFRRFFQERVI